MPVANKPRLPKKLSVDFSGVEDRKGGKPAARVPEGDYVLKVVNAEVRKKEGADSRYISWELLTVKGAAKSKTIYHITTLKPESLWSLRNFLASLLSREIPKKALSIDLDNYKNKLIGATIGDDDPFEKDGKTTIKSKIVDTFPAAEYDEGAGETDEEEVDAEEEVTSGDDDEDLEEIDTEDL